MRKKIVSHALAWLVVVLLSLTSPALTKADTLIDILLSNGDSGIVALAQDYEGLNEKKDRKDLKTAIGVDPVRTPWCAAFINHLLEKQGKQGTDNLTALSFLRWGKKTVQPKPGDIAVLYGHVTIFLAFSEDGKYIKTIGGNQDDSVKVGEYPLKRVISFRTYSEISEPEALPKMPKKKKVINSKKKKKIDKIRRSPSTT